MKKSILSIGLLLAIAVGSVSCSSEENVVKEPVVSGKSRTVEMQEFEKALKSYAKEKNALVKAKGDTHALDTNMAKASEKFLLISGYNETDIQSKTNASSVAMISMALQVYAKQTAITSR